MTTIEASPRAVSPDVEAIRHHYEVGNDFYRLILGPMMMYSGGYWLEGEDDREAHDVAQERKLDAFVDLANAKDAARVLDIGCGWGTMMRRLVDVHGVDQAVGLTLSRTQVAWISSFGNPAVDVRVESRPPPTTRSSSSTRSSTSCGRACRLGRRSSSTGGCSAAAGTCSSPRAGSSSTR
jgi:cyclopropane-fatty-acyl-phospholipid synthase